MLFAPLSANDTATIDKLGGRLMGPVLPPAELKVPGWQAGDYVADYVEQGHFSPGLSYTSNLLLIRL